MPRSLSEYLGKTVKSRQGFWYEVHETDEDADLHLVPVDTVPSQYVSVQELEERMADGWELVYDGTTGLHETGDLTEHPGRSAFAGWKPQTKAGGKNG